MNNKLTDSEKENLLETLKLRFEKNESRHKNIQWSEVEAKLKKHPNKLWSIHAMEITGGEPDVISYDKLEDAFIFATVQPKAPKIEEVYAMITRPWS